MRKALYMLLGFFFFGLGAAGAFVPVLPTTPFLLVSAFFFAKSWRRFNDWFVSTKLYKNNLSEFAEDRAMTLKMKLSILIPSSLMLAAAFILTKPAPVRLLIAVVILCKYLYFIFCIKTIEKKRPAPRLRTKEDVQ